MSKKEHASIADAPAIIARLEAAATQFNETLAEHAELCTIAAQSMRAMHAALTVTECPHTLTTTVTKAMTEAGTDHRAPGKYCMTCGVPIPKPEKPAKAKKDKPAGDGEGEEPGASSDPQEEPEDSDES